MRHSRAEIEMKSLVSTKCSAFSHPEFRVDFDEDSILEHEPEFLIRMLEIKVQQGSIFSAGQTIEVGLSVLRVAADEPYLSLDEPDMRSFPIVFVTGVTQSLILLRHQHFVSGSFALDSEGEIPSFLKGALVCTNYAESPAFFMDRLEPMRGNDSGWFIGCCAGTHDHNDPRNLTRVSLYAAFLALPEMHQYVSLPVGYSVIIDPTRDPVFQQNGRRILPKPNSFLSERMELARKKRGNGA